MAVVDKSSLVDTKINAMGTTNFHYSLTTISISILMNSSMPPKKRDKNDCGWVVEVSCAHNITLCEYSLNFRN